MINDINIVEIINNQPTTTSLKIAEVFKKNHRDVLRSIRNLECSKEFNERNFALVNYVDEKGEKRPKFNITKDGFVMLAMGFTGKEAMKFKEAYINAFNQLQKSLQNINKKDILRYAINLCETKIGRKIHISVIEFLKNHEYYRDGKAYNSCRMYDNFELWFLSNHNEKCINYFQFISSMRNMGFIKGQAPLGWDILVYREIVKTREDIRFDNTKLKYRENSNKRSGPNEYNIDNKWVEVNENNNREKIEDKNINGVSININNNNIIRKNGKIIINGNSLDPVEKMLLRKNTAKSYLKIAYKEKDINPSFYKIIQERVVKLYGTDKI